KKYEHIMTFDENEDEKENLKNRYKRNTPDVDNKSVEIPIDTDNKLIRIVSKSKNSFKYLITFFSFLIVLFLIVFIADKLLLPSIVHDRETVNVPSIEGKSLKEASEILNANNLFYEIVSEQYSGQIEGIILKQIPEPNKQVKSKRPIFITISKGKETIEMPDLTGISVRQARVQLYNNGLNIGDIQYTYSDLVPKDSVISQNIIKGKNLIYGDTVKLIVSKGPENQIYIPKLSGMAFEGIESYLISEGFKLGNVEFIENDTFVPGTIISQLPNSNTLAQTGQYINIVVAR
ncbi:MAG: PASTA domain-containing protein, partial [Candidatus Kapaibacterium sp.]